MLSLISIPHSLLLRIQRDLDTLTYSGGAINDLEIQLTRTKELHKKTLVECRMHVDSLSRKLSTHIKKSEPFIEVWRKARQVSEETELTYMLHILSLKVYICGVYSHKVNPCVNWCRYECLGLSVPAVGRS